MPPLQEDPLQQRGLRSVRNTIALVDDDQNILTSVSMALEAEGFEVRTYTDGDAALKAITHRPVDLTVTEFLILKALAMRPGHVKSRDQLMDAAYGESIYVDDRTIDSHIKRLRKKFKAVDDGFQHVETLYGVGYRFREI